MNRTLRKIQTFALTGKSLHIWGMILLAAGLAAIYLQNKTLGISGMTNSQLMQLLEEDASAMGSLTTVLILMLLEACAVPLYAFLLSEGADHTSHFGKYLLRVLGTAVLAQIPYSFVAGGLNPVFGAVMSLVMLYFFRRYPEKKAGHIAIKAIAVIGTYLWSNMMGIAYGGPCVLLTAVLWALRKRPNLRMFFGMLVSLACSVFSVFFMMSPLAFLVIYFYNGEPGEGNRLVNYLAYPVMLVILLAAMLLL